MLKLKVKSFLIVGRVLFL